MSLCYCPICQKEYDVNPKTCDCGFEGMLYPEYDPEGRPTQAYERETLFRIYQFTKRVYKGAIPYKPSSFSVRDEDDCTVLDYVNEDRGLALVNSVGEGSAQTLADAGLLAFKTHVQALILNVNRVHSEFLDESRVKVLFFGADVEDFRDGFFLPRSLPRYLHVDSANPRFCADNNVMFSKDMKRLICYAPARPEEEYHVPSSVRTLGAYSFYCPLYLKRLYLPRGIKIEDRAMYFFDSKQTEIVYE